jgi:hypothetical protein
MEAEADLDKLAFREDKLSPRWACLLPKSAPTIQPLAG